MLKKVLIANRGEIAIRIIQACREMNIETVAVYSTVDKDSLHVMLADEAVCIGNHKIENSYLNMNAIIQAAINTGADAIHPGYGFLSEKSEFVRLCEQCNIEFIGPSANTIDLMGHKANARKAMIAAGVPVVQGYDQEIRDSAHAYQIAKQIGCPVIIKAAAGGGGKGMKVAYHLEEVEHQYNLAQTESIKAFNDGTMYIEQFIENPRHIEVQVLADKKGNALHLFERECSMQRNNQKLIEEAPANNLSLDTREKLYDVSLSAIKHINYESAGTMEFIMDDKEKFYFIEMNTRIQVEHPVTEQITGVDIIKEQLRIASGLELEYKQEDISINGHAIEIRINSEDAYNNFNPSCGSVKSLHFPTGKGIRIESFLYQSYSLLPYYDSMIAKIISHGKNREESYLKAIRSLEEIDIEGFKTNIDFQLDLLLTKQFREGKYTTSFVSDFLKGDIDV